MNSVITYNELMGLNKEENMETLDTTTATEATTDETLTIDGSTISTNGNEIVVKKVYPQNLVAMNTLTRDGKAIVAAQGHSKNSFKRNYETGTAVYSCKDCGATLSVSTVSTAGITGTVLEQRCTKPAAEVVA